MNVANFCISTSVLVQAAEEQVKRIEEQMLAQEARVMELDGLYRAEMALRKKYFNTIEGACLQEAQLLLLDALGGTTLSAMPCGACSIQVAAVSTLSKSCAPRQV